MDSGAISVPLDEQLRFAIAHARLIQVSYHGKMRVAEPHDYGVQKGTAKLLIYQLRESDGPPRVNAVGWRLLEVAKIDDCRVLDETFAGSRGQAHERHCAWDVLYARVV